MGLHEEVAVWNKHHESREQRCPQGSRITSEESMNTTIIKRGPFSDLPGSEAMMLAYSSFHHQPNKNIFWFIPLSLLWYLLRPQVSKIAARHQKRSKQEGREKANLSPTSTRSSLIIASFQRNLRMFLDGSHVKTKQTTTKTRKWTCFSFQLEGGQKVNVYI